MAFFVPSKKIGRVSNLPCPILSDADHIGHEARSRNLTLRLHLGEAGGDGPPTEAAGGTVLELDAEAETGLGRAAGDDLPGGPLLDQALDAPLQLLAGGGGGGDDDLQGDRGHATGLATTTLRGIAVAHDP